MSQLFPVILWLLIATSLSAQSTIEKFIFIPHPRSEDKVNMSVEPAIEHIDFSLYDMILLGGDLTWYTSASKTSMDYCNELFDMGSQNTLWTMGNHDIADRTLVAQYTGRPPFYVYARNNITFVVLDTEEDAIGFVSSHIPGDQVTMLQAVADTITNSDYLVLLHHRMLWMIGDDHFDTLINYVGESTKQLDTSNFNTVVYPILQQVRNKGIRVICLGGDKAKINIQYSPEDSITYLASTMAPEFLADTNDVIIFSHEISAGSLNWEFVPLSQVPKKEISVNAIYNSGFFPGELRIWNAGQPGSISILLHSEEESVFSLRIFTVSGLLVLSDRIMNNERKSFNLGNKGVFIAQISNNGKVLTRKFIVD